MFARKRKKGYAITVGVRLVSFNIVNFQHAILILSSRFDQMPFVIVERVVGREYGSSTSQIVLINDFSIFNFQREEISSFSHEEK